MNKKAIIGLSVFAAITLVCGVSLIADRTAIEGKSIIKFEPKHEYKVSGDWLYVDSTAGTNCPAEKGEIFVYGYIGSDKEITIPSELDDQPVTGISWHMADYCYNYVDSSNKGYEKVKKVTVPESVKSLGSGSLGFPNLETLVFEEGFRTDEKQGSDWLGSASTNVKSITLPESFALSDNYKAETAKFGWWSDQTKVNKKKEDLASNDLVIKCAKGSWGEKFARKNNFCYKYTGKVSKKAVPAPAYNRQMKVSKKAIVIKWHKNSNTDGYKLYQRKDGEWKVIKTLKGAGKTKYKVKGLKSKKVYKFKIKAYKKIKGKTYYSPASNTIKIKTK